MSRAMIVEGRTSTRVATVLGAEGFEIARCTADSTAAIELARSFGPAAVVVEILDLNAAVVGLCGALAAATNAPVMVCYEMAAETGVVSALSAGASIVVAEPLGPHELVARVRALVRRTRDPRPGPGDLAGVLTVGSIVLDRAQRRLTVAGQTVAVPPRELAIAEILMSAAGTVVRRERLMRELWGSMQYSASLAVQVGRLRARLMGVEGQPRIFTVRGVGYRFATDDESAGTLEPLSGLVPQLISTYTDP